MATLANPGASSQMAFGQFGCAFLDDDDHILVPPAGMVVVAIQCLGDTEFDILTAEDPNRFFNTAQAAHNVAEDTVATGVTNGTFIDMNGDDVPQSRVGQSMLLKSDRSFIAKVKSVGTDSAGNADASAIELDRVSTVTAADHLFIDGNEGTGGHQLAVANVFPKGMTIYGRWTAVSLAEDQNSDGAICYFGPANNFPE